MFDSYAKKLASVQADVPKIFKATALKGAKFAENKAKELTDQENLVDTGNYRRNWNGERIEPQEGVYGVVLENSAEYASYLEDGHKLKNGGRWNGRKVGRRTLDDTEFYCLEQLDKAFEKTYTKYHQSFTEPQE
ncbi:MAG: HK97 gp10 family phage protein [Muribaculaceae bacterium]|nr:HK97 gp10 family phage protein [Muribaculaceae bacterium]